MWCALAEPARDAEEELSSPRMQLAWSVARSRALLCLRKLQCRPMLSSCSFPPLPSLAPRLSVPSPRSSPFLHSPSHVGSAHEGARPHAQSPVEFGMRSDDLSVRQVRCSCEAAAQQPVSADYSCSLLASVFLSFSFYPPTEALRRQYAVPRWLRMLSPLLLPRLPFFLSSFLTAVLPSLQRILA